MINYETYKPITTKTSKLEKALLHLTAVENDVQKLALEIALSI